MEAPAADSIGGYRGGQLALRNSNEKRSEDISMRGVENTPAFILPLLPEEKADVESVRAQDNLRISR